MRLSRSIQILLLSAAWSFLPGCGSQLDELTTVMLTGAQPHPAGSISQNTLYQVSVFDGLLNGLYDGVKTVGQLKEYGDFGLGTFDGLDGEMILLDGTAYRAGIDGIARLVNDAVTTPFASVTRFQPDIRIRYDVPLDWSALQHTLDQIVTSKNVFNAIRVDGTFSSIRARSVPRQTKPYTLKLTDVVKGQSTFEFKDIAGTLVGFRCPTFAQGTNVAGYHFHFLSDDRTRGGHVFEATTRDVIASIHAVRSLAVDLPDTQEYLNADLQSVDSSAANTVERVTR